MPLSKNPSSRPHATHARSSAAEPARRTSRTAARISGSRAPCGRPHVGGVREPGADQRRGQHGRVRGLDRRPFTRRAMPARRREQLVARRVVHAARDRAGRRPRRPRTRPTAAGGRGSWWCRRAGRTPTSGRSCRCGSLPSSPISPSSGRLGLQQLDQQRLRRVVGGRDHVGGYSTSTPRRPARGWRDRAAARPPPARRARRSPAAPWRSEDPGRRHPRRVS